MKDAKTRAYQEGRWLHNPVLLGQSATEFSLAWEDGIQPAGVTEEAYRIIELSLHKKVEQWLNTASAETVGKLQPDIWEDVKVGAEGVDSVKRWRVSSDNHVVG